jgi:hypothetical protein
MKIEARNGIVHYYGNKAGYTENDTAVIDTIFATPELSAWLVEHGLAPEWRDGVYDTLMRGGSLATAARGCRIWQLKRETDALMKFISYDEMLRNFGEPKPEDYETVYDGQIETNDLNEIFEMFNINHPQGFMGHSLSMSDVVELYNGDNDNREFHYVDRFGFTPIRFGGSEPTMQNEITM